MSPVIRLSVLYLLLGAVSLLGSVGCSLSLQTSDGAPKPDKRAEPAAEVYSESGEALPFDLRVLEAVNDGERLHVLARVTPRTNWNHNDVVARLTALRGTDVVGVAYYPFVHHNARTSGGVGQVGGLFKARKPLQFSVTVAAQQITDYQLELLWGEEARGFEGSPQFPKPSLRMHKLQVESQPISCGRPPCDIEYRITGELLNSGRVDLYDIVVSVGFVALQPGEKLDLSRHIPDNVQPVELKGVRLKPGDSQRIRLVMEYPPPIDNEAVVRPWSVSSRSNGRVVNRERISLECTILFR